MKKKNDEELMTATPAAQILGCSSESVRRFEGEGILPAIKTPSGLRLFREGDVLRLRHERRSKEKSNG